MNHKLKVSNSTDNTYRVFKTIYILGLLFKGHEMLLSELFEPVDKELVVSVPNANCIQFCDPTQPKQRIV